MLQNPGRVTNGAEVAEWTLATEKSPGIAPERGMGATDRPPQWPQEIPTSRRPKKGEGRKEKGEGPAPDGGVVPATA
jgi:hypothetical protein